MPKSHALAAKIGYALLVAIIYIVGRNIPLPWVEHIPPVQAPGGVQAFISQVMGSEMQSASILALGLSPWMSASIITSIARSAAQRPGRKSRSPKRYSRLSVVLTLIIALVQGYVRSRGLTYLAYEGFSEASLQAMTVLLWTAGAFVTTWLCERNKTWGLGGQSLLILINLLYGVRQTLTQQAGSIVTLAGDNNRRLAFFWSILALVIILVSILLPMWLQDAQFHLPIVHVMLDSPVTTDSYLAISMMPTGTFPAMYSMSLFSLPYYLLAFLSLLFPGRPNLMRGASYFDLTSVSSVGLFLIVFCVLTFFLSLLMIDPGKIAEGLERSGDFIDGVRPGKETGQYIRWHVLAAAAVSCIGMGIVVVLPLFLRAALHSTAQIFMLPITLAMLSNMILTLLEEIRVEWQMQHYDTFL